MKPRRERSGITFRSGDNGQIDHNEPYSTFYKIHLVLLKQLLRVINTADELILQTSVSVEN